MGMKKFWEDFKEMQQIPRIEIDLMKEKAKANDPFFLKATQDFYEYATRRHPKMPLVRFLEYGVAVYEMPKTHEEWMKNIEASARRNVKKGIKKGYTVERINFNDHLEDIGEIHASAEVRQGKMSEEFLSGKVDPISDPESKTNVHDYPYFGVMKDGKVYAYAGCLVAGEMFLASTIFGHDKYKSDGLVPLLFSGMAAYMLENYPEVKYYVYDKYYGASENLRRFKRKFLFLPYHVTWRF